MPFFGSTTSVNESQDSWASGKDDDESSDFSFLDYGGEQKEKEKKLEKEKKKSMKGNEHIGKFLGF